MCTLVGPVVWVTAMESFWFPLLVGLVGLGISVCMCEVNFLLHCSGPLKLLNHVVIVDYCHSFVLGFGVTVLSSCHLVLYLNLDSPKMPVSASSSIINARYYSFTSSYNWSFSSGVVFLVSSISIFAKFVFNEARVYSFFLYKTLWPWCRPQIPSCSHSLSYYSSERTCIDIFFTSLWPKFLVCVLTCHRRLS